VLITVGPSRPDCPVSGAKGRADGGCALKCDVNFAVMEDPFAVKELRIRQPARMLPGRARFDIFDQRRNLLAVATETEPRSALQTMASLVPRTRTIGVRSASGEPMLTLIKRDDDWVADVNDPAGQLIGRIKIGETRRHYTLLDEADQVAGQAVGDLAVKQFTITGPDGERYARLRKTWAGLGKELLTSSDHYTVTFTGPMPPRIRTLVVMVPIVLDMVRYGPY
jgi:uncharacterized protein YxjI